MYEEYSMDVGQCLTQYGFRMESHLLMTCTIAIDVTIREMNTDALEIAQLTFNHNIRRYQEIFDNLSGNDPELRSKIASAWYYVTYSEPITPMGIDFPILSFPWVILNRQGYPRDMETSLPKLIADDMKSWFIGSTNEDISESTLLVDILSQKLSLLHQIDGILDPSFDLKVCLREFLLTGQIVLYTNPTSSSSLSGKLLKAFPSATITNAKESNCTVTIDSTTLIFQSGVIDRSKEFSSQIEYVKGYLCKQFGNYELDQCIKVENVPDCVPLESFDNLVAIEEVPKALRSWNNWILSGNELIYLNLTNGLLDALDLMISSGLGSKIDLLKIRHGLIRTCRIKCALSIANEHYRHGKGLQSRVIRSIVKNPRILRQIGSRTPMGPVGNSVYVQGAAKSVFIGSSGEGDLLKFDVLHEGRRQLSHLLKICYKISLKSGQVLSDDTFAFNEYWTHLHRQFHYLRKFGGPEYGKLHVSVKLGQFYATELPRIFMEQPVSIWLARVALEKAFKSSKWGRKKQNNTSTTSNSNSSNANNAETMDFSQLKCNPRTDSCVDETISSNRVTQSIQSLIESAATETEEKEKTAAAPAERKKSSKSFGKMSTAFESVVNEETVKKLLSMWKFKKERTIHLSLSCYDESSNTNTALQVHYDIDKGNSLKSISQRGLRWAVVDVLNENEKCFDSRISVSSFNTKTDNLGTNIFSDCLLESFVIGGPVRVREEFRSNPTIYARIQEGHSAVLRDDFSLIIRKISEHIGLDPQTGLFAVSQDKWEIEANMTLDWDEIHDYQYRDQLIFTMWSISKSLRREC